MLIVQNGQLRAIIWKIEYTTVRNAMHGISRVENLERKENYGRQRNDWGKKLRDMSSVFPTEEDIIEENESEYNNEEVLDGS